MNIVRIVRLFCKGAFKGSILNFTIFCICVNPTRLNFEIKTVIRNLKKNRTVGDDKIPAEVFINTIDWITPLIKIILNVVKRTGQPPKGLAKWYHCLHPQKELRRRYWQLPTHYPAKHNLQNLGRHRDEQNRTHNEPHDQRHANGIQERTIDP